MPSQLFKYRRWAPVPKRGPDGNWREVNYTERLLLDHSLFCQGPREFDDPHDSSTGAFPTGSDQDIDRFLIEDMAPVIAAMRSQGLSSLTQLSASSTPQTQAALRHIGGQRHRRQFKVVCLSATSLDEVMWAL